MSIPRDPKLETMEALAGGPKVIFLGTFGRIIAHDDEYWPWPQLVARDGFDLHCRTSDWIADWHYVLNQGRDQGWGSHRRKQVVSVAGSTMSPWAVVLAETRPPFWKRWLERARSLVARS